MNWLQAFMNWINGQSTSVARYGAAGSIAPGSTASYGGPGSSGAGQGQLAGPAVGLSLGGLGGALLGGAASVSTIRQQNTNNGILGGADAAQGGLVNQQIEQNAADQATLSQKLMEDKSTAVANNAAATGQMPPALRYKLLKNDGLRTVATSLGGISTPANVGGMILGGR